MVAENLTGFEMIGQNLPAYCIEAFKRHKKPDALNFRGKEGWENLSGETVIEKIKRLALGLSELGVKEGEKVAIIAENRPEW